MVDVNVVIIVLLCSLIEKLDIVVNGDWFIYINGNEMFYVLKYCLNLCLNYCVVIYKYIYLICWKILVM